MAKKELESKISGRKPSNEVDVCGPKSGDASRPSIKRSGIDNCELAVERDVIDQMFAAQLSMNESEERIAALRPQVEEAVRELMREMGLPKNWTGTIPYHGFKIVISRPKSYTWEQNTNPAITSDPNHAIYLQQLDLQRRINEQLKDMRADVKRTAEKLEKEHPDSESIKHGFRMAFLTA